MSVPEPAGRVAPLHVSDKVVLDIMDYVRLLDRIEKIERFIKSVGGDLENPPGGEIEEDK